jgi:hypothetical protein
VTQEKENWQGRSSINSQWDEHDAGYVRATLKHDKHLVPTADCDGRVLTLACGVASHGRRHSRQPTLCQLVAMAVATAACVMMSWWRGPVSQLHAVEPAHFGHLPCGTGCSVSLVDVSFEAFVTGSILKDGLQCHSSCLCTLVRVWLTVGLGMLLCCLRCLMGQTGRLQSYVQGT